MRILFYNNWHNGDMHFTREFIKDIINKTDYSEYYYLHTKSEKLFLDIPELKISKPNEYCLNNNIFLQVNDDIYINTWIGTVLFGPLEEKGLNKFDFPALPAFYYLFQYIYKMLNIQIEQVERYVPDINYSVYDIGNIQEYLKKNKLRVLIENSVIESYQSESFDINYLIHKLSDTFPHIDFILTERSNIVKDNVLHTSDIIMANGNDLNEISYLSNYCFMIIGRSSGPYAFTQVKSNINNRDKTFVCMCNQLNNAFWNIRSLSNKIWINKYDAEYIYTVVVNEIKKKFKLIPTDFQIRVDDNRIYIKTTKDINDKISIDFIRDDNVIFNFSDKLIKDIETWIVPFGGYQQYQDNMILRIHIDDKFLFEKVIL